MSSRFWVTFLRISGADATSPVRRRIRRRLRLRRERASHASGRSASNPFQREEL